MEHKSNYPGQDLQYPTEPMPQYPANPPESQGQDEMEQNMAMKEVNENFQNWQSYDRYIMQQQQAYAQMMMAYQYQFPFFQPLHTQNYAQQGYAPERKPESNGSKAYRPIGMRNTFNPYQIKALTDRYNKDCHIRKPERGIFAQDIGLKEAQVKIWFQNRRYKDRKKKQMVPDEQHASPESSNTSTASVSQEQSIGNIQNGEFSKVENGIPACDAFNGPPMQPIHPPFNPLNQMTPCYDQGLAAAYPMYHPPYEGNPDWTNFQQLHLQSPAFPVNSGETSDSDESTEYTGTATDV